MPNSKVHTVNMMQRHTAVCLCIVAVLLGLSGCQHAEEVHFHRFEQLLFNTPTDQLQAELKAHQEEYNTELILLYPDEPEFMQMTQEFVEDPVMRDVYRITDSLYHDLSDVERQLGRALGRAYKLYPKMPHVEHFYTMITGDFDSYQWRIFSNCSDLCIGLDHYSLGAMERYHYFGMPNYIVRTLSREYIVPDCIYTLARLYVEVPDGEKTLLDHAIADGKKLYFMEKVLPGIADTLLLRYSKEQLDWMQHNTEQVWSYLIQNRMLYSTDQRLYNNFLGDAPHTNAFGNGSAPRTVCYIGWQIVHAYMKKSGATMEQLFDEPDSQKILTISAWRP